MTYEQLKSIADEFAELETDIEKYRYLISHPDKSIFIFRLDNDDTYITFSDDAVDGLEDDQIDDSELAEFESCIGNDNGVFDLLRAIGFKVEGV